MLDKYSKLHKYDCIVHKSNGVKIKICITGRLMFCVLEYVKYV